VPGKVDDTNLRRAHFEPTPIALMALGVDHQPLFERPR
jgi:hypothetical protein